MRSPELLHTVGELAGVFAKPILPGLLATVADSVEVEMNLGGFSSSALEVVSSVGSAGFTAVAVESTAVPQFGLSVGAAALAGGITGYEIVESVQPEIQIKKGMSNADDMSPARSFRCTSVYGEDQIDVMRCVRQVCEQFPLRDRVVNDIEALVAYYHSGAFKDRVSKQYYFFGNLIYSRVSFHDQLLKLIDQHRGRCHFFSPGWKTAELMKTIGGVLKYCDQQKKDYFKALWSEEFDCYKVKVVHAQSYWDNDQDCYKPDEVVSEPVQSAEDTPLMDMNEAQPDDYCVIDIAP